MTSAKNWRIHIKYIWNCTKWFWKIQSVYNKGTSNCICSYHLSKKWSWGHSGCSAVGWNGKGCDDWQPLRGSQLVQNSTGNVLAKLLLTCCPIRDRGGTREVFKKRGIHTYTHRRHNTQSHPYAHSGTMLSCTVYTPQNVHKRTLRQTLSWFLHETDNTKHTQTDLSPLFLILASNRLYNTLLLKEAQRSYINKPYVR